MIIKLLIMVLLFLVIPELIGLFFTNFIEKEKTNIVLAFVLGYIVEFAIAQIITVPLIFMDASFKTLLYLYMAILLILSVISVLLNIKRMKEILKNALDYLKSTPKLLGLLVVILICMQIYAFIGYAHIDDDDAYYVGMSTVTVQTNTLFKYSAVTGKVGGEASIMRYRLGPFPVYAAMISELVKIHPAIISHIVFPIIFIPIVYMIYGLIANKMFNKDKKSVFLFLLILCFLFIWGNYSIRNNFTFCLFRIWQGKAILANIIIPLIWLLLLSAQENEFKLIDIILLTILNFAGNFTTTMGTALPPLVLMISAIVYEIAKLDFKNINKSSVIKGVKNLVLCLITCIPSIVYGIVYFLN